MNRVIRATGFSVLALLSACALQPPAGQSATTDYCATLNSLLAEADSGFSALKGARTHTRYADIWDAKFHAIGKDCQIWESGQGALHYVCTRSAPDAEIASDYQTQGARQVQSCLGPGWQVSESEPEPGASHVILFSHPGQSRQVLIQRTLSRTAFGSRWTVFYMVGKKAASR